MLGVFAHTWGKGALGNAGLQTMYSNRIRRLTVTSSIRTALETYISKTWGGKGVPLNSPMAKQVGGSWLDYTLVVMHTLPPEV